MDRLFFAIAVVESGLNPLAVGDRGTAVGILQIRPCVVKDCNEWLRRHGVAKRYTLESRWSVAASREMFYIYLERWAHSESDEVKARVWNGGPRGASKRATVKYWRRVRRALATHPACQVRLAKAS